MSPEEKEALKEGFPCSDSKCLTYSCGCNTCERVFGIKLEPCSICGSKAIVMRVGSSPNDVCCSKKKCKQNYYNTGGFTTRHWNDLQRMIRAEALVYSLRSQQSSLKEQNRVLMDAILDISRRPSEAGEIILESLAKANKIANETKAIADSAQAVTNKGDGR